MLKKLLAFSRRRKRLSIILAALTVVLVATLAYVLRPPPVIGPPIRVVYWSWHVSSPGGGPCHTNTSAFEVDLERGRWRRLSISGTQPQPMPGAKEADILWRLRWKSWQRMDEEHYRKVRAAVESWIASKPPSKLECLQQGRESGGVAKVIVTGPDVVLTTDITSGGFAFNDPSHKLWNELHKAVRLGIGKPLVVNGVHVRAFSAPDSSP